MCIRCNHFPCTCTNTPFLPHSPMVHIQQRIKKDGTDYRPTYAFDILGTASNAVYDQDGNQITTTYMKNEEWADLIKQMQSTILLLSDKIAQLENRVEKLEQ